MEGGPGCESFRADWLAKYERRGYAQRHPTAVRQNIGAGSHPQWCHLEMSTRKMVARYLFKVIALKDDYEVARRHATPAFRQQIAAQFECD